MAAAFLRLGDCDNQPSTKLRSSLSIHISPILPRTTAFHQPRPGVRGSTWMTKSSNAWAGGFGKPMSGSQGIRLPLECSIHILSTVEAFESPYPQSFPLSPSPSPPNSKQAPLAWNSGARGARVGRSVTHVWADTNGLTESEWIFVTRCNAET